MISRERLGVMFILVGPGGVGKNALLNEVLKSFDDLRQLPTATTRPMRPSEQQGREHNFVSEDAFRRMLAQNELLEYQEVHPGQFYGVPRTTVEDAIAARQDLIADIEIYGAAIMQENYPDNSVAIFIAPPSIDTLIERLNNRQATSKAIQDRMERLPKEMLYAPMCRYIIVNDDVDQAADELRRIILVERGQFDELTHPITMIDVSFSINVCLATDRDVLYKGENFFIHMPVQPGESPDEIALRLVQDTFAINPVPAHLSYGFKNAQYPFHCDYQRDQRTYHLQYNFTYHVPDDFTPPDGWELKQTGTQS